MDAAAPLSSTLRPAVPLAVTSSAAVQRSPLAYAPTGGVDRQAPRQKVAGNPGSVWILGVYGWILLLDVESAFIKSRLTILNPSSRLSFSIWSRTDDPRTFSAIAPPSKLISQGLGLGSERILSPMFSAGTC
ncbi:predicted protein [Histoplasma capsulatum H143]|uniref:Uncharacterized protein n=1 Tax=Ajellomyces capsulatus (strain H143) TaxID=544712 RepID=C6HSI7_AJECH|nr:predicted protein [Histoplasma capsulatum H143]